MITIYIHHKCGAGCYGTAATVDGALENARIQWKKDWGGRPAHWNSSLNLDELIPFSGWKRIEKRVTHLASLLEERGTL